MVTGGVTCGYGSTIGGRLPHGGSDCVSGSWCGKQLFLLLAPAAFPQSLGCVLCWAAGQRRCCFRPSGCFLYPLCSCHTLLQEEPDMAAQCFVVLLSSRKCSDCYSLWSLFWQQQSYAHAHTQRHTHLNSTSSI